MGSRSRSADDDQVADRNDQRHSILGKPLKLAGLDFREEPIDFSDYQQKIVAIVFISFNDSHVLDGVGVLSNLKFLEAMGVRFVCCEAIPRYDVKSGLVITDQIKSIVNTLAGSALIPYSGATELLAQHPIVTTPYAIILDQQHNVIRTNVNLDSLRETLQGVLEPQTQQ